MNVKEKIIEFMSKDAYKPMLLGEIMKELDTSKDMKKELFKTLTQLEEEGKIVKTRNDRYAIPQKMNLLVGTIQGSSKGYGFFIADDKKIKDLFIAPADLNGAMNGDKVIVRPVAITENEKRQEGKVIRIISRNNNEVIGLDLLYPMIRGFLKIYSSQRVISTGQKTDRRLL